MSTYEFPGTKKILSKDDLFAGIVLRKYFYNGSSEPFSDMVVLGFEYDSVKRTFTDCVHLARPYLYASGTNTVCPTPLTGVEVVKSVSLFNRFTHNYNGSSAYLIPVGPSGNPYVYDVTESSKPGL